MKTKMALAYVKFLNLTQAVNELPQFPSLDPNEQRLLNYFASAWYLGKKMTVLQVMHTYAEISPSTVHRRLKSLRHKGLIDLDLDPIDNRIKYIVDTELTSRYFTHLGKCLAKAVEA